MDTVDQSSDRKGQCDVRSIHWHVKTAPISELNNGVECYSWKICPNVNILSYSWASHHLLEVEEALFRWSTLDLPPFMVQTGPTQHEAPALSPLLSSITLTRKSLPTSRQILFEFSSYLFCISKEWCSSEDAPSESLQERTIKEVAGQWKGWNCSEYLLSGWFSYWRRRCYFFKNDVWRWTHDLLPSALPPTGAICTVYAAKRKMSTERILLWRFRKDLDIRTARGE